MTRTVYLADLRHNFAGVLSTDCMPLGVGYMKAVMDRDLPCDEVRTEVFAYASELAAAIDANPPDVLMVSNYVWNEGLSRFCMRRARQANPHVLNVMGGPNLPVELERQLDWVRRRPEIDVYALGEGDFLASEIVRLYLEAGGSREGLAEREIPSCAYRRRGTMVRTEPWQRSIDLNDIPSPWLTGVMDKFFDGKLAPLIETNRGCPFSCSFCVQGNSYYTRITQFSLDRLRVEIDYIARRIHSHSPSVGTLRIADANYGMYSRDVEISAFIGRAQLDYGWPTFVDATTGKNKPENVIRSMEQIHGGMVLYQSVQSLDEDVLRRVRRSNIKLSAFPQLAVHIRGRGLRSSTDLIMGLPGDTLTTHLGTLQKMIDMGCDQAHCFQAMMLKGSEMESLATREEYGFVTKFRLGPKNFGEYGGEKVFDTEEIVAATSTLPFEDYVECRKYHLTFSVFWNDSWFSDLVGLASRFGIKNFEWLKAMLAAMQSDSGPMNRFLQDFVDETKGELFDTEEECIAYYSEPERYDQLMRGQIGDNLMYKYRAVASFFLWNEVCDLACATTERLLRNLGAVSQIESFDELWSELLRYVKVKHATGARIEELTRQVECSFQYNIPAWLADGSPSVTRPYRFDSPHVFAFSLNAENARELDGALKVWSARSIGLSKLITRIRFSAQVRDCQDLNVVPSSPPVVTVFAAAAGE
jgi:radical SAM superfamily enzyme YgiQ (UPF0313 family)